MNKSDRKDLESGVRTGRLIYLGITAFWIVFHLICVYYIYQSRTALSAGISLVLPWVSEAYWTYSDFHWLYLTFVIIGGLAMFFGGEVKKLLAEDIAELSEK